MKKALLFVLTGLALASCTPKTYMQIVDVKSNSVPMQGKNYVYSDANCKITYNFWDAFGNPGFIVENLTDQLLYVNLAESFYTSNGVAYDYFRNRTYSKAATTYRYGYAQPTTTMIKTATPVGQGVSFGEKEVMVIPPHAVKTVSEYNVVVTLIEDCDVKMFPKKKRPEGKSYNEMDSPVKFSNYLTYKVGEKGAPVLVNNDFYVAGFKNYNRAEVTDTEKYGCKNQFNRSYNKYAEPTKFYINYGANHNNVNSADAKPFNRYFVK